jgi:hypothetical protein
MGLRGAREPTGGPEGDGAGREVVVSLDGEAELGRVDAIQVSVSVGRQEAEEEEWVVEGEEVVEEA